MPALLHCSIATPDLYRRFMVGGYINWRDFWNVYGACPDFKAIVGRFSRSAELWGIAGAGDPETLFINGVCPEIFGICKEDGSFTDILGIGAGTTQEGFMLALNSAYLNV